MIGVFQRSRVCMLVLLGVVLMAPNFSHASSGVLYLVPGRVVRSIGDTFTVELLANTDGAQISAAEADLSFNPAALSVVDISTDGSVLSSWPTPPYYSNEKGTISFSGWSNDHYAGFEGLLLTITFRAERNMSGSVNFQSGALLADDGQSTNIITAMHALAYAIEPRDVVPTIPDSASTSVDVSRDERASAPTSVLQPVFTQYESTIAAGERLILKGMAPRNARVSIWMAEGDSPAIQHYVMSGSDGSFTYVSNEEMESGTYYVYASAVDSDGAQTPRSNEIEIIVASKSLTASAGVLSTGSMLAVAIGVIGFGMGYLWKRRGV